MDRKLPFVSRIFWKVLVAVAALAVVSWMAIVKVTDYEITPADYGGSTISGLIFAYLVHLWLLRRQLTPTPLRFASGPSSRTIPRSSTCSKVAALPNALGA